MYGRFLKLVIRTEREALGSSWRYVDLTQKQIETGLQTDWNRLNSQVDNTNSIDSFKIRLNESKDGDAKWS